MSKINKPRLGRGLSSLLSIPEPEAEAGATGRIGELKPVVAGSPPEPSAESPARPGSAVLDLPVDSIQPNPHQPRRDFNEASLAELAASLKSTGLIQPVIVRRGEGGYELIAGERRLRAAKIAGLATIPAIAREVDGYTQAQMALIENIQREDLNPLDRAIAYRTLVDQLGLTQAELAGRLGEDRTVISHYLRLLDLCEPVRQMVRAGRLTVGHGKLLAGESDPVRQQELAQRVVAENLSVRNLERILQEAPPAAKSTKETPAASSAHLKDLEKSLSRQLGMRVQVKWSSARKLGKLVIFYNLDQFDDLKSRLGVDVD